MIMTDLQTQLKELRLVNMAEALPNRLKQAHEEGLSHQEFLNILLQHEMEGRHDQAFQIRLKNAEFESNQTMEGLICDHYPQVIQQMIRDLFTGTYLTHYNHILIMGQTGTGKTHLAHAFGHQACRQGYAIRFMRAKKLLDMLNKSRADLTIERTLKRLLRPKILILDDFALHPFTEEQSHEMYELIADKHQKSSFIITSNRPIEAWVDLFPDPVMGNAALDRLANQSYHITLEGESFRKRTHPQLKYPKTPSVM